MSELSRSICRGFGRMFEGIRCDYLRTETGTDLCTLLGERRIMDICRKGRCTYSVRDMTQKKMSQSLPSLDEGEDLDLERVFGRLERNCSERTLSIDHWFNLVGLAFRNASIDLARRRGVTPSANSCGACNHLTSSNPFHCLISGEFRAKGDSVCEDYSPFRVGFEAITNERPIDAFLLKESIAKAAEDERQDLDRRFVESIEYALRARVLKETNTQRRSTYTRQYNVFVNLRHALKVVDSVQEAAGILARQLDVPRNTVRDDIQQIRAFLQRRGI